MNVLRNKWMGVAGNLLLVSLLFAIMAPVYDLFHFINQLFYIAYFYLFVGILLWVIRGGFFDAITYSMRRFYNRVSKQQDYLDDWKQKPLPSQTIESTWLKFFLFHGGMLTAGLLALLALYYNL
ncbi:hypothetical protein CEH05_06560 [Halobacillus halophilus]|uniref:DUF3899 domain-containing protein n=1 Tax=Halobacillus halophilus (strain ATCC 35676 / DSM 2266 / JCM 20832 / KCTC 3685 / LMG 17431 / NBRC 102448 / NCIMB 2269) TaxID=866895 RepID=I0JKI1_HALH3|nr:DUF3899 domain-containing protein [Halobacillus halophilus]ASF38793.1 hypothetical protein CEH05_06560 [Halobacillus halophilus]CCG44650.1 hypothetical protein HBHAL_2302 [Halobacillus halophilus DSM 2266]